MPAAAAGEIEYRAAWRDETGEPPHPCGFRSGIGLTLRDLWHFPHRRGRNNVTLIFPSSGIRRSMIVYKLCCKKDHEFEAWFRDSGAADEQIEARRVVCPRCGTTSVSKALMAPRLGKPTRGEGRAEGASAAAGRQVTNDPEVGERRELVEALRELRRHVESNCDYVGDRFAEEARKIHYGEVEHRDIYGEASSEEAKTLREEGVEVFGIPWLPRHDS